MGPWLNFSSGVIHLRNMESGSELDLLVVSMHIINLRGFYPDYTLGPYVHLDI